MTTTLHAAFFRNVNLGRPNCPTRAQLEAAFLDAGAARASSFLVNGTLVYACPEALRPRAIAARARVALQACCGLREPVFVRSLGVLAAHVARRPFAGVVAEGRDTCCITFLQSHKPQPPEVPSSAARGAVEFLAVDGEEVFSVARLAGSNIGSPNAVLERMLAAPATTRAWRTIERLVSRHG